MPKHKRTLEHIGLSDSDYMSIMEKVANENYANWGFNNPDEALLYALNDKTYNYRGYYNKYPKGKGNAIDHWTDEFKTVYHPTFSNESIYSGKVDSNFNPNGFTGGMWLNDIYIPPKYQSKSRIKFVSGGKVKSSFVRSLETQPTILEQVAQYSKEPKSTKTIKNKYQFYLDKHKPLQQRIREQKAANQRERNIAKHYLAAGPNIANLAKAAYHWYNSVPFLGGEPEDGSKMITGVVDVPGMRNPKDILKGVSAVDKVVSKITRFYHGSPVKFDVFDTRYIGSGEGGSKVMKGVNLWPEEKIANAPKLANIKSPDAPIHLGVSSTPLGGKLNPTVYDVSGKDLKLYKATPREIKSLKQEDLVKQGYDGVQTPNQVTVFPESIGKLSIDKQSSIEDFVMSHPEVERWTPWTTDAQKMQNIVDASKMRMWTPAQWTAAQDAAIARGDIAEAQRLRDLHFRTYQNGDMVDVNGNPIHVYHGSPEENITEFYKPNDPRLPAPKSINFKATGEEGIYTSPRRGYAARYTQDLGGRYHVRLTKEQKELLKAGKSREEIGLPPIPEGRIYDLYSNTSRVPEDLDINFNPFTLSTEEANIIKSKGYSGFDIPSRKYPEHVVLEPNQLKSADAVTYNNGVRIPLGDRDNFNINDIRYAIAPILAGGIGYGAYRNQKASGGSIHIAPSKRGTFTAASSKHGIGVQEFANRVLANKENYSPAMVKKANFARNASKWKH